MFCCQRKNSKQTNDKLNTTSTDAIHLEHTDFFHSARFFLSLYFKYIYFHVVNSQWSRDLERARICRRQSNTHTHSHWIYSVQAAWLSVPASLILIYLNIQLCLFGAVCRSTSLSLSLSLNEFNSNGFFIMLQFNVSMTNQQLCLFCIKCSADFSPLLLFLIWVSWHFDLLCLCHTTFKMTYGKIILYGWRFRSCVFDGKNSFISHYNWNRGNTVCWCDYFNRFFIFQGKIANSISVTLIESPFFYLTHLVFFCIYHSFVCLSLGFFLLDLRYSFSAGFFCRFWFYRFEFYFFSRSLCTPRGNETRWQV